METCKGVNCTSDGTTPHSAECAAEYERCTKGCEFDETGDVTMTRELFDELHADANRYRAIREFACEPDEATRERMEIAMDGVDILVGDEPLMPELFDAVYDKWVAAIVGARDANR